MNWELDGLKLSSRLSDAKDVVAVTGAGAGGGAAGSLLPVRLGELDDGSEGMGEDGGRVESSRTSVAGAGRKGGNTRGRLSGGAIGRSWRRFS